MSVELEFIVEDTQAHRNFLSLNTAKYEVLLVASL